jgi:hypothetical protein
MVDVIDAQDDNQMPVPAIGEGYAQVNVTWQRQNGTLPDPVLTNSTDGDLRGMLEEAIRNGDVPGIAADPNVRLADFEVDRFRATDDLPFDRIAVRPKTAYGVGA